MTSSPAGTAVRAGRLSVLGFTVIAFMTLDTLLTAVSVFDDGMGPRKALYVVVVGSLSLLAVGLMLSRRWRWCALISALAAGLAMTVGPSSEEQWVIICVGVTAAATLAWRSFLLALSAMLTYSVAFGSVVAVRFGPSEGLQSGVWLVGMSVLSVAVGLIARRFLAVRERRRQQVRELERENLLIHRAERAQVTDELRTVIDGELRNIRRELGRHTAPGDVPGLLAEVQRRCHSVLMEVRTLLGVLRETPAGTTDHDRAGRGRDTPTLNRPGPRTGTATSSPAQNSLSARTRRLLGARWVRITATTAACLAAAGLLGTAVTARTGAVSLTTSAGLATATGVLTLLCFALAIWRPAPAAVLAGALAVLPLITRDWTYWGLLPPSLLCLLVALKYGSRRAWGILLAVAIYCLALAAALPEEEIRAVLALSYCALIGIAAGLFAFTLREANAASQLRMAELQEERQVIRSRERGALARELHDLVGHQLSLSAMLVMASEGSTDEAELARTLQQVRQCIDDADAELVMLVHAMRSEGTELAPLITPRRNAESLAETLRKHGFLPTIDVDPNSDRLSPTTLRTLSRIMQEATTNIIRYAPRGATCDLRLRVERDRVLLRVANPVTGRVRSSHAAAR